MESLIRDITMCVGAAWVLGVLAQFIGQPALLAYLVGGFILGPSCLHYIHDPETIASISEIGLIFLLFMIGLEIDLKKIASAGRSITVTAASQIIGGFILGVIVFKVAGFALGADGRWDALYLGVAAAGSSTVIIVKLLYDKRELDTLAGRITLGVVVLQDLFSILFLAVQPNLDHLRVSVMIGSFVRVAILVVSALGISRYVLPHIFRRVARVPELMLVGALAWCFLVGELGERLGLSREMGALIAGVALSTFPYALDITAKVTSLRDFFVTLFFVGLGLQLPMPTIPLLGLAAGVLVFTVVSRFVTTFTPLYLMKTGLRISLLPSINLSQISEFSLVVLALGLSSHHISAETSGAVSIAFVVLAVLSTFAIMNSDPFVRRLIPGLKRCGLKDLDDADATKTSDDGHGDTRILILGFFRTASSLLEEITHRDPELLRHVGVLDFNPVVYEGLKARGVHVHYGDISQRDTLVHAGAAKASVLVCTIPESLLKGSTTEKLVRQLREINPEARILVTSETLADVERLKKAGASYVSLPRLAEASGLFDAIKSAESGGLEKLQAQLSAAILERREVLP